MCNGGAAKCKKTTPPSSGLPLPKFSAPDAASATVYFTLSILWHLLSMYPSHPEHENRDAEVFLKKDGETVTVYYIFGEKRLHF